ncbi:hypothetical protein LC76P1_00168 [Lysinibacillus phage LC76P1]|nr:hypothetical protein LC76P1_00168 [Lysinibacillus phage LC76P1]
MAIDNFKQKKTNNRDPNEMNANEKMELQIKKWTTFYRANMHRFIEHYLGVELFLFQKILMYFMNINTYVMIIAARGLSKSWMIGLFCIARCILYPNTKIVIASGVKKQAKLIITEKIQKDFMQYPNIEREIKAIKTSANDASVVFKNGSTIEAVTSSENSRGYRANILILEEFRMIDKDILTTVLQPFLNVYRQPPFLKKPEYRHLTEENVEIYISSAWFESHWMGEAMKGARDAMLAGVDTVIFALDYLTSLYHGLLSRKRIENMKKKSDFDHLGFMMEYENLMFGENENALYAYEDVIKNRTLKKLFYPIDNLDYSELKNKRKAPLMAGEVRIIGVDIALMGGKGNDNTVYTLMRLIPNGDSYARKVVYIESLNGAHSEDQAIRLKQLFEDFQCHYVAMDCHGNGMSIYDDLVRVLYDEARDVEYEAWCSFNDEEMKARAKGANPLPVVFSIKAGSKINHEVASSLRVNLQNSNIELPYNEQEAREDLSEKDWYAKANSTKKSEYLLPYHQTTALVNELVNLDFEVVGGFIKVKEGSTKRKDRYSSIGYANYLAKILEAERLSGNGGWDLEDDYVIY